MNSPVLLVPLGFLLVLLIGLGPALRLIPRDDSRRLAFALCLAPVVGMAEAGLVFQSLFYFNVPIIQCAGGATVILLLLSAGTVTLEIRSRKFPSSLSRIASGRALAVMVAGFMVTLLLLVAPPLIGGQETAYWQSNPGDFRNYLAEAAYAKYIPIENLESPAGHAAALRVNPSASIVLNPILMYARPAVAIILAWLTSLVNVPLYTGLHYLKILFLLLSYSVGIAVATKLDLKLTWRVACAIVLSTGFWAVLVADIDALSQISSLSLMAFVLFAWILLEQNPKDSLLGRPRLLFGVALGSLMTFYPEGFIATAACIVLYVFLKVWVRPHLLTRHYVLEWIVLAAVILIVQLPSLPITVRFMFYQANNTITPATLGWEYGYFGWAFSSAAFVPQNLWGMYLIQTILGNTGAVGALLFLVTGAIALGLTFMVIQIALRVALRWERQGINTIFAACVIGFGVFVFGLFLYGRIWVGMKTIAMAFPFIIVTLFWGVSQSRSGFLQRAFQAAFMGWVVLQFVVPVIRTFGYADSLSLGFYPNPPRIREFNDIPALLNILSEKPGVVGYDLTGFDLTSKFIWETALSEVSSIITTQGMIPYDEGGARWWLSSDRLPDYFLTTRAKSYFDQLELGQHVVTGSATELLTVTASDVDQTVLFPSVLDPDRRSAIYTTELDPPFLRDPQDSFVRWTTRLSGAVDNPEQTLFRYWASDQTAFAFWMRYAANYRGNLVIQSNGDIADTIRLSSDATSEGVWCIPLKAGISTVRLEYQIDQMLTLGTPEQRLLLHDLVFAASQRLDLGTSVDGLLTGEGWHSPETWGNENIRWATQSANLMLLSCEPVNQLRFRAFSPINLPLDVTVMMNDVELGKVNLIEGWEEYTLTIPANVYRPATPQRITLLHSSSQTSNIDTRDITAAYDWFELENLASDS